MAIFVNIGFISKTTYVIITIRFEIYKKQFNIYYKFLTEPWTPYWEHIKEGLEFKEHPNVLFMFYEDINEVI